MGMWNYLSPDTDSNNRCRLVWYLIPSFHRPSCINTQMDVQDIGTVSQGIIQRKTQRHRFESIDFRGTVDLEVQRAYGSLLQGQAKEHRFGSHRDNSYCFRKPSTIEEY